MPPSHRDVTLLMAKEPRCSKFREDFGAPFVASIVEPNVTPSTETGNIKSDLPAQTETFQDGRPLSRILRSSRFSWSSGSQMSAASAAFKRWKGPLKKLKDGAGKLWRSEKIYYAGSDDADWS